MKQEYLDKIFNLILEMNTYTDITGDETASLLRVVNKLRGK